MSDAVPEPMKEDKAPEEKKKTFKKEKKGASGKKKAKSASNFPVEEDPDGEVKKGGDVVVDAIDVRKFKTDNVEISDKWTVGKNYKTFSYRTIRYESEKKEVDKDGKEEIKKMHSPVCIEFEGQLAFDYNPQHEYGSKLTLR